MNLFCFGLEGSTDSLYEAPQPNPDPPPWSPMWGDSEPCVTPELLQSPIIQCKMDLKKAKRKSRTSELTRIGDKTASSNVYCPCTGKRDDIDLVHHQTKDVSEDPYMINPLAQEERIEKIEKDYDVQVIDDKSHLQKIKKPIKSSVLGSRYPPDISDVTVITCIGLSKKPEKKFRKESSQQSEPGNERDIKETVGLWNPGHFHHHWSSMDTCSFWESSYHTCHRPTADPWLYNVNFTLPRGTDRHRYEELINDLDLLRKEYPPLRVIHSFTDLDMTDTVMVSPWS
ncbi:uncharacterized protein LOC131367114 isoform X2 [Hemibagrus wyckioides]|uniref:uncharacterized protein LOC131367114 isoform X2 n=1 Tax=Hemibagrus wyckioides TaxID=337641 RepID=UPI00266D7F19|nr:uncharacterized protein LOC131367114 isoform X2 [Hemibagrus wyckioides]